MRLLLCCESYGATVDTTLDNFLAANSFEAEEIEALRTAVQTGKVYHGGGGAAPEWFIGTPAAVAAEIARVA